MGRPRIRAAADTCYVFVRVTIAQRAAYRAVLRKGESLNTFGAAAMDREVKRRAKAKER